MMINSSQFQNLPSDFLGELTNYLDLRNLLRFKRTCEGTRSIVTDIKIKEVTITTFNKYNFEVNSAFSKIHNHKQTFGETGIGGMPHNPTLENLGIKKISQFMDAFGLQLCSQIEILNLNDFSSIPKLPIIDPMEALRLHFANEGKEQEQDSPLPLEDYLKKGQSPNLREHFKSLIGVIKGTTFYGGSAGGFRMPTYVIMKRGVDTKGTSQFGNISIIINNINIQNTGTNNQVKLFS